MSALYRIHRPLDLSQVVGQAHVVRTLTNAIESDRVAHAYLFAGPRGTGKTSLAKILAKSLNCEQGPTVTPCLVCESCRTIHDATAIDVIEMDAASDRGIDDVREINDRIGLRPVLGRRKIYIIDEAHMLTKEASNAVLKTLEEPPDHVVFVLCTTEMQSMLPTIRSRCQRFAFHRPTHAEIGEVLDRIAVAESIEIDPSAVSLVAAPPAAASATPSRCSTSCARPARSGSPPRTPASCSARPTRSRCSPHSTWSPRATPPARCAGSTSWPRRGPISRKSRARCSAICAASS